MTEVAGQNPFAVLPSPPGVVDYGKFGFTAKRFILAGLCESAAAAVPAKEAGHPALGCFQVRVLNPGLRIAATDMERAVIVLTDAVVCEGVAAGAHAETYIPARRLLAILKEVPEGDVSVGVAGNKATVTAANGAVFELRLPDAGNYPVLPDPGEISFAPYSREKLLAALRSVRHAVCKDPSRSNLTQVAVTGAEGGEVITAADGARLARASIPGFPVTTTVPSSVLGDLARLLSSGLDEAVEAGGTAKLVAFRSGQTVLTVQRRSMSFPDVDADTLQPVSANDQVLTADKAALQSAIRRVRINADPSTSAIALALSAGQVSVEARDKDGNSAQEAVQAGWEGADRLVVVSHVALDEALSAYPGTSCQFRLGQDKGKLRSMVLLSGGGLVQVLTQLPPSLVGY